MCMSMYVYVCAETMLSYSKYYFSRKKLYEEAIFLNHLIYSSQCNKMWPITVIPI